MELQESFEMLMEYRQKLIEFGKRVAFENPDRLSEDEIKALTERIFNALNQIDMKMGYPYHDTGITLPESITKVRQEELFVDFLDWYQVIETPSAQIYDYVTENYSTQKYPKILCVGDGENCHLGRKLTKAGYHVVSVDPFARKEFSTKKSNNLKTGEGTLHVVKGSFEKNSDDMIDWADVIVGSKIPLCAETIVEQGKPAVFNISNNAEIYHMKFKGKEIHSSQELIEEIKKCQNVRLEKGTNDALKAGNWIIICNERQKEYLDR